MWEKQRESPDPTGKMPDLTNKTKTYLFLTSLFFFKAEATPIISQSISVVIREEATLPDTFGVGYIPFYPLSITVAVIYWRPHSYVTVWWNELEPNNLTENEVCNFLCEFWIPTVAHKRIIIVSSYSQITCGHNIPPRRVLDLKLPWKQYH